MEEGVSVDGSTATVVGEGSLSESFLLKKDVMGGEHCWVRCLVALVGYLTELDGQLRRWELTDLWSRIVLQSKQGLKLYGM